jgi:ABC-type amino acid transport system permease subunit
LGAELYADLDGSSSPTAGQALGVLGQSIFVGFYQSFPGRRSRWRLYLKGVGTTLEVTILALLLGIVLGVLVAVIRTSARSAARPAGAIRDLLGFFNAHLHRSIPPSSAARP